MPLQILPRETNWGESLGTGLGAGLSKGMQALADMKMQEYAQRQQASRAQSALEQYGIPKEQAQAVSQMDPMMQQAYFKNYLQAPQNEAYANAWQQILGGGQQAPLPETGIKTLMADQQAGMPSLKGLSKEQIEKLGPIALTEQYRQKKLAGEIAQRERQQEFKEMESVKPFLHAEKEDYKAQKQAADIARKMLDNLERNKAKWPGTLVGNLPTAAQSLLIRDPHVRKYIADANSLVSALAGTRKGVPTNFKLKLEALSKADLSQPIEAQREILQDVISKAQTAEERIRFAHSLKDKKTGKYPLDIEQKVTDYELAKNQPFDFPEFYKPNTVIEDDNGKRFRLVEKNGSKEWKEL
jgi:hypothetical protein